MYDEKLVLDNINLIYAVLKKLHLLHKQDDYFDLGMIGLIRGAKTYDKTKNIKPSTYLYRCIHNEICNYFKGIKEPKEQISLYKEIHIGNNGIPVLLEDAIPSNVNIEEDILHKDLINELYLAILKLNDRERTIICSYYGICGEKERTIKEIAELLNLSTVYVNKTKLKTIEKLRNIMYKEEL